MIELEQDWIIISENKLRNKTSTYQQKWVNQLLPFLAVKQREKTKSVSTFIQTVCPTEYLEVLVLKLPKNVKFRRHALLKLTVILSTGVLFFNATTRTFTLFAIFTGACHVFPTLKVSGLGPSFSRLKSSWWHVLLKVHHLRLARKENTSLEL